MRMILLSLAVASLPAGAMAQAGPTTSSMTCAQARGIVAAQGAVVLHTGPTTYDRFVRDPSFCALRETSQPAWVSTADVAQCPIGGVCRSLEIETGR